MTEEDKKLLAYARALLRKAEQVEDKHSRDYGVATFWYDVEVLLSYEESRKKK